jgi:hypothetical protein
MKNYFILGLAKILTFAILNGGSQYFEKDGSGLTK